MHVGSDSWSREAVGSISAMCLLLMLLTLGCGEGGVEGRAGTGTRSTSVPVVIGAGAPGDGQTRNPDYPWIAGPIAETVESRFRPPRGYERVAVSEGGFAEWLRGLPVYPGRGTIHLYDGTPRKTIGTHVAVLAVDVGDRDLQQCADAVIRLRAEYLRCAGRESEIAFRFTSGDLATWSDWQEGMRPRVDGERVSWARTGSRGSDYASFRAYLETVFTYAGTSSVEKELEPVVDPALIEPGDVFIVGGFPGHAMLVLDVAENRRGARVFLLCQSLQPAQEIHVVQSGRLPRHTWQRAKSEGRFFPAGWQLSYSSLRRFPHRD